MKTLDCNLMINMNGERTSVSKRVAELDKIVPESLGVSPAILNTVIFCHQDESLWPMSEPAKLKKQFDDIFEAQQYTKAVDTLKVMRKAKVAEGNLFKQTEEHTKVIKDKAERVRKQMELLFKEMEALHDRVNALGEEMDTYNVLANEKRAAAHVALGASEALKSKKTQAGFLRQNVRSLEANLEEYAESDEWLESTLEKYAEKMAQYQEEYDDYTTQYTELLKNTQISRENLSARQAEQGRQQAAKDSYEKTLESRLELVKEASRAHSIRGFEGELDDRLVESFTGKVQKASQDKDRELERVKKGVEDELAKVQEKLDQLNTQRTTAMQEKLNAQQTISANGKKIERQEMEAGRVKMTEGTKASLDAALIDIQGRVQRLKSEFDDARWDQNIKTHNTQLRELESEQDRLNQDFLQCSRLAESRAALEYTKTHAKDLMKELDIQKSTYNSQFMELIAPDWDIDSLDDDFRNVLDRRTQDLAKTRKQQQSLSEDLNEINLKLKTQKATLAKKIEERQKSKSIVLSSIETADGKPITSVDQYEPELSALREEHDQFMKDFDGMNYISEYYVKAKEIADSHNACRLCERPFPNQKEKTSAIDKINKLIAKYATKTAEEEKKSLTESWKKASDAKFHYDLYMTLNKSEVPSLEKEIKRLENDRNPLLKQLEHKDTEVSEKEAAVRGAESHRANINTIVNLASQLAKNEDDIARQYAPQSMAGVTQSADELGAQLATVRVEIDALRKKIDKMQTDRNNAIRNIGALERDETASVQRSRDAQHQMERKQEFLATAAELRKESGQLRGVVQKADEELERLLPQDQKEKAKYADIRSRGRAQEKEVQVVKDELANTVNKFQMVNNAINAYVEDGGPEKLASCQRAIKSINQELKQMEAEQKKITKESNELKKRMDDGSKTKRNMEDNLTCRRARRELQELQREIDASGGQELQDNYDRLDKEAIAANLHYQKVTAERAAEAGKLQSKDEQYAKLQEEWDTDYHDASDKYRESHIKVATNTAACDDLGKFTKALDEAIMKYHTVKMQEINAVAGELWRNTYQGTDVDTIMIKSESENAANKRAINYRLVMIKQDSEMDMRGRCSAGQRVLACIIIRLALAECFGINCGVGYPSTLSILHANVLLRSLLLTNQPQTWIPTTSKP